MNSYVSLERKRECIIEVNVTGETQTDLSKTQGTSYAEAQPQSLHYKHHVFLHKQQTFLTIYESYIKNRYSYFK